MQVLYVLILSLFVSMVLIPPLSRVAPRFGLIDRPGERKIHAAAIPRTGGIAIFAGTLLPILLWLPKDREILAILVAMLVLFIFGVLDDRFNLSYRLKLLGQLMAAVIAIWGGGVLIQYVPFSVTAQLPLWLAVPITLLVLVGITNAINLSDGLDGLAGGISLLALGCLAVLAHQNGDTVSLLIAFAMMGATFGFLRFNTNPAQVFMGDAGSQFLGFGTAVLAIAVTQREDTAFGKLVPILILGLPILDTLSVMTRRIAAGRSPFSADRLHLHHQLLSAGMNQFQAVSLVYGVQALLVVTAYLMRYSLDIAVLVTYLAFALSVLVGLQAVRVGGRTREAVDQMRGRWALEVESCALARLTNGTSRLALRALQFLVPLLLVAGALVAHEVSWDVGALAGVLLVAFLIALRLSDEWVQWFERFAVYIAAITVVFLASNFPPFLADARPLMLAFGVLGLFTALWVRYSAVAFRASTLDLLILLIALALPSLSADWLKRFGHVALQSIVLFYAAEVLLAARTRSWDALRIAVLIALAVVAFKGLVPMP